MPKAQKELWRLIVARLPWDWFKDEHLAQLRAYCQHVCIAEMLGERLEKFDPATLVTAKGALQFERLARQLDREHRVMLGLARALRLTVASCHDPITAGRKARATAASADPWRAIG